MVATLTSHPPAAGDIIIISGPTASGKTTLAINVAHHLKSKSIPASIVNFDSLCFYRELNIGTAKPTPQERSLAPHYMIDVVSAKDPLTAADYASQAITVIDQLHRQGQKVILTGGSAFYLRALIMGMFKHTQPDHACPSAETEDLNRLSPEERWQRLEKCDPINAKKLHPNDHYRILRALKYYQQHGKPFSLAAQDIPNPYDFNARQFQQWRLLHLYLNWPKEMLSARIQLRVEEMFQQGIVEEHRQLLAQGFSGQERPLQSVGHYEVGQLLRGECTSIGECKQKIAIATRQLAKSQRTFFNKIGPKESIDPTVVSEAMIFATVDQFLSA